MKLLAFSALAVACCSAFACPPEHPNCALTSNGLQPAALINVAAPCPPDRPECTLTVNGLAPAVLATPQAKTSDTTVLRNTLKQLGTMSLEEAVKH